MSTNPVKTHLFCPAGGWRAYLKFIGSRTLVFLGSGAVVGVLLFLVEMAFAYSLQAFLVAIKVMPESTANLPSFVPRNDLIAVLALVASIGIMRGAIQWTQVFLLAGIFEHQRYFQRIRLLRWAFRSHSVSSGELFNMFEDGCRGTGSYVQNLQTIAQLAPAAGALWLGLAWLAFLPTIFATVFLIVLGLLMRKLDKVIRGVGHESTRQTRRTTDLLLSNIKNLFLMQIYGTEAREEARVRGAIDADYQVNLSYQRLVGLKFVTPIILGALLACAITLVAERTGYFAASSVLISYFYLFVRFVQNLSELTRAGSTMLYYEPRFRMLYDWWLAHGQPEAVTTEAGEVKNKSEIFARPVGWRVRGLSFEYPGSGSRLFESLDLDVKPGAALVITGESGAGKSTLLYLLLGNIEADAGRIELFEDGQAALPLATVKTRLLQSLGYVGPDSFLLEGTLKENLFYGLDYEPGNVEVDEALKLAECDFVSRLPDGLGHRITDQGQGLSAGQKQRLALARALLRKPKVLVLDEATANLDEGTEARLVATLQRLKGQMTILAVTHRKALASIADLKLSLDR